MRPCTYDGAQMPEDRQKARFFAHIENYIELARLQQLVSR
jgi:hypothetical protein